MDKCEVCKFGLWHPVKSGAVSSVGLNDDARYPGRCIVMLNDHYNHLDDVPTPELFLTDVIQVGTVLRETFRCERVNYAVLGNTIPHVHAHVIPRYGNDRNRTRPIWENPEQKRPLAPGERDDFIELLKLNVHLV